jgi:hypothetical protein
LFIPYFTSTNAFWTPSQNDNGRGFVTLRLRPM